MGVSLNIMKRELEAMGNVSISSDGSLDFENARLYLGESSIAGDDILYVCSTSEDCESVRGCGSAIWTRCSAAAAGFKSLWT